MDSSVFFGISTLAYAFAMVTYITYTAFKKHGIGVIATTITITGFVCQTIAIIMRWKEFYDMSQMGIIRSAPLTNLYESLVFFIWCLIFAYLIVEFKYKNRSFGAFVTPVAGLALAFIDLSGMSKDIQPLVPALQSNWLLVHVLLSFIAYATFSLSFSTGAMYLIATTEKKTEGAYIFWTVLLGVFISILLAMGLDFMNFKVAGSAPGAYKSFILRTTFLNNSPVVAFLSYVGAISVIFAVWQYGYLLRRLISAFSISPDILDEITYKSIAIGFPIFTLGGLIFGAIWADQAWGVYWSWDPKETWSLITWFFYAFYLHARLLRGWRGHKTAVVAVLGFVAVIFTYLGVNLLLSGLHAYGTQ
jgi:cytochrome c-type biogenesis protein CcsB